MAKVVDFRQPGRRMWRCVACGAPAPTGRDVCTLCSALSRFVQLHELATEAHREYLQLERNHDRGRR